MTDNRYELPMARSGWTPWALAGLLLAVVARTAVCAVETTPVILWDAETPRVSVVVGEVASDRTRAAAESLREMLSRMAGAPFDLVAGDGRSGLAVGLTTDFPALGDAAPEFSEGPFDREDYVLRSFAEGAWLLGSTELAVEHAVWDFLYRLGFRQYFPGVTWEIVPELDRGEIAVDTRERPDFHARRIWYNWGLWDYNADPYRQWSARNRVTQGFRLNSGHVYGAIHGANRTVFEENQDYYALVDGERRYRGGDTKFCAANPGLRQLVVDHAVRQVRRRPDLDSLSMDPSDGGNWCECDGCAAIGLISDRALTLANAVAEAINSLDLGEKYVGMYAYNEHSPPPSIAVHPKVIISVATAFLRGGYSLDDIITGWRERGATLGIYDYFSVIAWDWNMPRRAKGGRLPYLRSSIPRFHADGARFHDAESGDAWGPYGLGYFIAGRLLWDIDEADRIDEWVEDFIVNAFGPAQAPMREFYHLMNEDGDRRSVSDLLARFYRLLDVAREAADGHPDVLRRLDDLTLYIRYVELYDAYANAAGNAAAAARDRVVKHAYRMRRTMMVHTYGLWARTVGQGAARQADHPLKDDTPFSDEDIAGYIRDGMARHEPVEVDFTPRSFSRELAPARAALRLPEVEPGNFPGQAQDRQTYYLWIETAPFEVTLPVTVQHVWDLRPHRIELHSPRDVAVEAVAVDTSVKPDGTTYQVGLPTPYDGLHRLEIRDGGDYTRIRWPADIPVTVESGSDTPGLGNQFRGAWSLYFYVPRGTDVIGGWAQRVASWAPRVSGRLLDADGQPRHDFTESGEGWFSVPVPEGQDGRLWKFDHCHGMRQLMTVPPYMARSADDLLLPIEVIDADSVTDVD